jgi:hypothetical protein
METRVGVGRVTRGVPRADVGGGGGQDRWPALKVEVAHQLDEPLEEVGVQQRREHHDRFLSG